MAGVPDSCGAWAPCLNFCDGVYYLLFAKVRTLDSPWKDKPNYVVTSDDILGD